MKSTGGKTTCFLSTLARSVLRRGLLALLVGLCLVGQAIPSEDEVRDAAGYPGYGPWL
jgi:hypothetical protein